MSRTRKLIIAFWIFIGCMLLWQFYSYDQGVKEASIAHPQQTQFIFLPSNAAPVSPTQGHHEGPNVQQTAYSVEENTPSTGSMTCHVTLKNLGNAKAVGVQVMVRPYRGTRTDDEDVGRNTVTITLLDDNDPSARLTAWLSFPDLAPGESSTQSAIFFSRSGLKPGPNLNPEILFQTEKAKP